MTAAPPTFWRAPRLKPPLPRDEITIPDPPPDPAANSNSLLYILLPVVVMATVMVVVSLVSGMTTMLYFSVPLILASSVASVVIFLMQRKRTREQAAERLQKYRAILQETDQRLQHLNRQQARFRGDNDPGPHDCLRCAQELDRRLWSRRPGDDDFLTARLGVGELPSTVTVKTPAVRDVINPDPLVLDAQALASNHARVSGVPICVDVREARVFGIAGERLAALNMAFTCILHLALHHAPGEVKLAAVYPAGERAAWAWLRWLPHTWDEEGATRFLAHGFDAAARLLTQIDRLLDARRRIADDRLSNSPEPFDYAVIVFLADEGVAERNPVVERLQAEGPELGVYPVFISARTRFLPQSCRVALRLDNGQCDLIRQGVDASGVSLVADTVSEDMLRDLALALAPIRLRQSASREIPSLVTLLEQLGVRTVDELNAAARWQQSAAPARTLVAPVGMAAGSEPLLLDLHEKADGPNGLVAGMVGAGKSELLQTLVASLAVNYHPHQLAFVLIDYKGGGMADPFVALPHTLGVITNLQQEGLARRALTSLTVELERRQQLFKDADVNHIDDYHRRFYEGRLGARAEPVPYLVVIVDEFAEMKTEQPEVAKEFVRIARLGRALGFRLILAMQKPAGIVDGQIEANTRFRLCLRVAQTEDSLAMLKRNDAAYLAGRGRCILQVGANEKFREFQVAWAGAPYDAQQPAGGDPNEIAAIALDGTRRVLLSGGTAAAGEERSQLKAVVEHLAAAAAQMGLARLPKLWLPPLPPDIALEQVRPDAGWDGAGWRPVPGWLAPVVGLLDRPRDRIQAPCTLPLGREGHLVVYSAPGYGKTTALQTLVVSLACDHSPAELHMYLLDYGGRLLKMFERLPHVGAVITADEGERLERLALFLRRTLDERREKLGTAGVPNLASYRQVTGDPLPAIVVMVDNYANLMDAIGENEALANLVARLAQDGGNLGVHLVVTANNSATIRFNVTSNIMLALALHLVEPGEYGAIVGRAEELTPAALPGRALVRGNPVLECQIALPVAGDTDAARSQARRALVDQMRAAWQGPLPARIAVLPDLVPLAPLLAAAAPNAPAPFGLHVDDLTPFAVTFSPGTHYVVGGPPQSGKSTLLRSWAQASAHISGLPGASEPAPRIFVADSQRQSLAALRALAQVEQYSADPRDGDALLRNVEALLAAARAGGAASSPPARILLLVDDLWDADEGITPDGKDLLGKLMRDGRGLPFHLIAAGRLSDLVRGSYSEPVRSLKEAQVGFILGAGGDDDLLKTRLNYQERNRPLPVGEGYFVNRGVVRRVKVAM